MYVDLSRFVCRDAHDELPQDCNATLAEPLPPHAVAWAQAAGQEARHRLTAEQKLRLLCSAAASGSEANLKVAWAMLLLPDEMHVRLFRPDPYPDPSVAAVRAGHPRLLGWLVRHCPGLLQPPSVMEAAAQHCDLAGLRAAWGLLRVQPDSDKILGQGVLHAAAGSATPDAVAKMEWLMEQGCRLDKRTTAAAARSGDMGRLQWLRERGCPVSIGTVRGPLG